MRDLPPVLEIPTRGAIDAVLRVPGSKSITNRALLIAALASGESLLSGALESDDTLAMVEGLTALGCEITLDPERWRVQGRRGKLQRSGAAIHARSSGTTARFLTAAAALAGGTVVIDGSARMRERPISDLTDALERLGVRVDMLGQQGCPPVRVHGGAIPGGPAEIDARRSSQFVSAVLLAAPYARSDVVLRFVDGVLVSKPYVDLTLDMMRAFGAEAGWSGPAELRVKAGRGYRGREYAIEPDASAAVYPFCAAAISGGRARVEGLCADSIQADLKVLGVLEEMGCEVQRGADFIEVRGPVGRLRGARVDMNEMPDAALAIAVVALFAGGPTQLLNIANLRIKETDRLHALETELRKLGASAHTTEDTLSIEPGRPRGAEIETYDDHRMAMSFALAGLRIPGVSIRDPACVRKTWPEYFEMLERL
ncbi:MAG TPA: 3-phosphoshikimate 1-carboxyvinyltransferase [Myxococcota bacterium]